MSKPITEAELALVEEMRDRVRNSKGYDYHHEAGVLVDDEIPALIAEVRRLRKFEPPACDVCGEYMVKMMAADEDFTCWGCW